MPEQDIIYLITAAVTNKVIEKNLLQGNIDQAVNKAVRNSPGITINLDEGDVALLKSIKERETLSKFAAELNSLISKKSE